MLSNVPTDAAVRCLGLGSWKVILPVWSWRETFGLGLGEKLERDEGASLPLPTASEGSQPRSPYSQSAFSKSFYLDTTTWLCVTSASALISSHFLWESCGERWWQWWWWPSPGSSGLKVLLPLPFLVILPRDIPPRLPFLRQRSSYCFFKDVTNTEIISLLADVDRERYSRAKAGYKRRRAVLLYSWSQHHRLPFLLPS